MRTTLNAVAVLAVLTVAVWAQAEPATYHWDPPGQSTSWILAGNWDPDRDDRDPGDFLYIDKSVGWVAAGNPPSLEGTGGGRRESGRMPVFYRYRAPGGTYFFTAVTHRRQPIPTTGPGQMCLRQGIEQVRNKRPFEVLAICLLGDHLHTVWTLPEGQTDYSTRWQLLKRGFTRGFLLSGGGEAELSVSRRRQKDRGVWQRRFWEHTCRDEADVKRCVDYVHWNPVKHGLVERVVDWPWSSFHRFVRQGEYPADWGGVNPCPGLAVPE